MSESKKILIVEDEEPLLKIMAEEFRGLGFTVFTARDGEEGLKLALNEAPDLMMVDVLMPKMDGISMVNQAKQNDRLKQTPVIMLTNLNDPQATAQALESGAYDYMVKSDWDLSDVVERVKEKLNVI